MKMWRMLFIFLILISIFVIIYDLNISEKFELSNNQRSNNFLFLQFSPQDIEINVSRVSGVAPLAVFFDGIGSLGWNEIESFDFDWNFGDGKTFSGYMASNVFETPGNYNVSLTVSVNGSVVAIRSVFVNVTNMTGRTICVSSTSNFTGCPSFNSLDHFNDLTTAWNQISTNTSFLLKKGDTFFQSTGLNSNVAGPVYFGAFGYGPKPLVRTSSVLTSFSTTEDDWRFRDIRFVGVGTSNTGGEPFSEAGSHKLMQNLEIINASFSGIGTYSLAETYHDIFIHDNYIETPGRYCSYSAGGYRFSFVNVTCIRPGGSNQGSALRSYVREKILVHSGFTLEDLDATSANYRIYPDRYVLFSNVASDTISYSHLSFSGSQAGSEGEIYNNIIVERNLFKNGSAAVVSQARNITVRNNLGYENYLFSHNHAGTAMNVRVYGNTVYESHPIYGLFGEIYTPVISSFIKNNVFYSPCNSQQGDCNFLRNNNVNGADVSNNVAYLPNRSVNCINSSGSMGSSSCTNPLFTDISSGNFAPLNNSPLLNKGQALGGLFEDYFGNSRYSSIYPDIGGIEALGVQFICTNGQTQSCPLQQGVCAGSNQTCTSNNWPGCSASNYGPNYSLIETGVMMCSDGLDNDCDGTRDLGGDSGCPLPQGLNNFSSSITTNLSTITNFLNITNFSIGVVERGRINYVYPLVLWRLSGGVYTAINLANAVNFGINCINVNSELYPELNQTAAITFYNLSYNSTPKILVSNGTGYNECPNTKCYVYSYNNLTGELIVVVAGFSNYTTQANISSPDCGDNVCNGIETCSTCSLDCGICSSTSGSVSGGSGGSGGSGRSSGGSGNGVIANSLVTQCNDGMDNDGDGLIDYPHDIGCTNILDNIELNEDILSNNESEESNQIGKIENGLSDNKFSLIFWIVISTILILIFFVIIYIIRFYKKDKSFLK